MRLQDRVARLEAARRCGDGRQRPELAAEVAHALGELRAWPGAGELADRLRELLHRVDTGAATAGDSLVLAGCSVATLRTMHRLAAEV